MAVSTAYAPIRNPDNYNKVLFDYFGESVSLRSTCATAGNLDSFGSGHRHRSVVEVTLKPVAIRAAIGPWCYKNK